MEGYILKKIFNFFSTLFFLITSQSNICAMTQRTYTEFVDTKYLQLTVQSHELQHFLLNEIRCDVSTLWQDAIDSIFSEQAQVFDKQVWPERFIAKTETIKTAINNAFTTYIQKLHNPNETIQINAIKDFKDLLDKLSVTSKKQVAVTHFDLQPSAFLETISIPSTPAQSPATSIVIKDLPINAVIIKNPTIKQFLNGIKEAIISYFDFHCLSGRLQNGDGAIFEQPEFPIIFMRKCSMMWSSKG